jgi:uncharacterized protein YjgD (DUF1641 family)
MSDKLKDIKNTASDAVEIIRELGTPEVQDSLEKIRETAKIAKEVMDSLRDPAMVANLENVRKTVESFEKSSGRIESAIVEMKSSGLLDEVRGAVGSAKSAMDSFGEGKGMGDTVDALKEMLRSISGLVEELRMTVASAKTNGIIKNVEETVHNTREIFSKESK